MNTNSILAFSAIAVALAIFVAPFAASDVSARHDVTQSNTASQSISQSQSSSQNSLCASGDDTSFSCNNTSYQFQYNRGNNAAGQQNNNN